MSIKKYAQQVLARRQYFPVTALYRESVGYWGGVEGEGGMEEEEEQRVRESQERKELKD